MKKLFLKDNYIVYDNGVQEYEYSKSHSVYNLENSIFTIINSIGNGRFIIRVDEVPTVFDEAGTTAFTFASMLDFLRKNTGVISVSSTGGGTGSVGTAKVPSVVVASADGNTNGGVKTVSLWFRGENGTLDGEVMPSGTKITYRADDNNDTINSIPFTVPTNGASEVIITYLT